MNEGVTPIHFNEADFSGILELKKDYRPKPGNLPFFIRYAATTRTMIPARITILSTTRPATHAIIFMKMLMAVAGGGACGCGAAGTGRGVATGVVTGVARGSVNRAKTHRCETCAVTIPVVASKVMGTSCQVPDVRSNDFTE